MADGSEEGPPDGAPQIGAALPRANTPDSGAQKPGFFSFGNGRTSAFLSIRLPYFLRPAYLRENNRPLTTLFYGRNAGLPVGGSPQPPLGAPGDVCLPSSLPVGTVAPSAPIQTATLPPVTALPTTSAPSGAPPSSPPPAGPQIKTDADLLNSYELALDVQNKEQRGIAVDPHERALASTALETATVPLEAGDRQGWRQEMAADNTARKAAGLAPRTNRSWGGEAAARLRAQMHLTDPVLTQQSVTQPPAGSSTLSGSSPTATTSSYPLDNVSRITANNGLGRTTDYGYTSGGGTGSPQTIGTISAQTARGTLLIQNGGSDIQLTQGNAVTEHFTYDQQQKQWKGLDAQGRSIAPDNGVITAGVQIYQGVSQSVLAPQKTTGPQAASSGNPTQLAAVTPKGRPQLVGHPG